jgi:hypothetical protein
MRILWQEKLHAKRARLSSAVSRINGAWSELYRARPARPNNADSKEDFVIARSEGFGNGLREITLMGKANTVDQV